MMSTVIFHEAFGELKYHEFNDFQKIFGQMRMCQFNYFHSYFKTLIVSSFQNMLCLECSFTSFLQYVSEVGTPLFSPFAI